MAVGRPFRAPAALPRGAGPAPEEPGALAVRKGCPTKKSLTGPVYIVDRKTAGGTFRNKFPAFGV
jgi:hypothetical protein